MTYAERKARNPEKFLAQRRAAAARDRAKNPDRSRAQSRKAYAKDPEKGRAYSRRWAARNPEKVRAFKKEQYARRRTLIADAKHKPCMDCGKDYPHYVMDLDHVRGIKVAAVSHFLKKRICAAKVLEEIAKCDVVCSNCHRERTHQRRTTK